MKKVINVVFYKFYSAQEDVKEREQACLFYDDGTVASVSVEEAVEATHQIAHEEKYYTKDDLRQSFNQKRIYVLSGEEFERRFQEFVVKPENTMTTPKAIPTAADYHMTQEAYDDYIAEGFVPGTEDFDGAVILDGTGIVPPKTTQTPVVTPTVTPRTVTPTVTPTTGALTPVVTPRAITPIVTPRTITPVVTPRTVTPVVTPTVTPEVTPTVTPAVTPTVTPRTVTPVVIPVVTPVVTPTVTPVVTPTVTPVVTPTVTPVVTPTVTPVVTPVATPTVTPPKKKNIFQRAIDKLKGNKIVRNIILGATALALLLTGYSCGARRSLEGEIVSLPAIHGTLLDETSDEYINLINQTTNEEQKQAMIHTSFLMDNFNTTFASHYVEPGKDVKAALTWDEMMALNLAYNDYSKSELVAMFNGVEVDSQALSDAYRNGTLQLMGAYVISDSEHPVQGYRFLQDEEERAFVEKYETMFYACKEAGTKEERIAAVNAFYAELYKDFPISDEVREEGISHAEGRKQLEPYKLAITPMVAATEMMFQNLEIDHTLADKPIAYFNDLGLCNKADEIFERAEFISLAADLDEKNPTYNQFVVTKIDELSREGSYNISDAERDLSQLDSFQFWVNGGFTAETGKTTTSTPSGGTTTKTWTETDTKTETHVHTETTDDRDEAVEQAGEDAVKKAEEEAAKKTEEENEAARKEAERKAEEERKRQQEEADKKRQEQEEQARQENEGLQEDIDNANDEIDNGGTVNEDDFGGNVDFDDDHSDENGNLDDSVTDITTDGTGAVDSDEPLPDPNDLEDDETDTYNSSSQTYSNNSGQTVYEYEETYVSNEELVDAYIRQLEGMSDSEASKGHSK